MEIKTWTVGEMLAERPCSRYTRKRIEELWAGKEHLSLLDILNLDIPDVDKVWAITRPGALRKSQLDLWLEKIVSKAIIDHVLNCGIPEVEEWGHKWLSGDDRTTEAAAWAAEAAAEAAAWAAARAAAWAAVAAAEAAAWAAAEADAWAAWAAGAAEAAAWAAAEAAAWAAWAAGAAGAAAWAYQVQICREILQEAQDGD